MYKIQLNHKSTHSSLKQPWQGVASSSRNHRATAALRQLSRKKTPNFRMWAICKCVVLLGLGLVTVPRAISISQESTAPVNSKHHIDFNTPQKPWQLGVGTVGMQDGSSDAIAITDSSSISQLKRTANGKLIKRAAGNRRSLLQKHSPRPRVPTNPTPYVMPPLPPTLH